MIDEIDRKILSLLQANAKIANAEISRQVGLVPSAVLERVRKLEEKKIISGYHTRLNMPILDYRLLAFVFVKTNENWSCRNTAETLAAIPHVLECHYMAGEDCYLFKICARDTEHLYQLLRRHLGGLSSVESTKTSIVFKTYKDVSEAPILAL